MGPRGERKAGVVVVVVVVVVVGVKAGTGVKRGGGGESQRGKQRGGSVGWLMGRMGPTAACQEVGLS
jgi:hypothetical protein